MKGLKIYACLQMGIRSAVPTKLEWTISLDFTNGILLCSSHKARMDSFIGLHEWDSASQFPQS